MAHTCTLHHTPAARNVAYGVTAATQHKHWLAIPAGKGGGRGVSEHEARRRRRGGRGANTRTRMRAHTNTQTYTHTDHSLLHELHAVPVSPQAQVERAQAIAGQGVRSTLLSCRLNKFICTGARAHTNTQTNTRTHTHTHTQPTCSTIASGWYCDMTCVCGRGWGYRGRGRFWVSTVAHHHHHQHHHHHHHHHHHLCHDLIEYHHERLVINAVLEGEVDAVVFTLRMCW